MCINYRWLALFPLKHRGGGDGSWHGILPLPTGTEPWSCCQAKKSGCGTEDLLEVGAPQHQWGSRALSTLREGTSVHLASCGSCRALNFGAAVGLACRETESGCLAGVWWEGAEKACVSLEVLDWDMGPEFTSFADPAAIWPRCTVLPLPHLAMRCIRIPAVFPPLCLILANLYLP